MALKSKPLLLFESRLRDMQLQLEGVAASLEATQCKLKRHRESEATIGEVLGSRSNKRVEVLGVPASQHQAFVNRLKKNNVEYAIRVLYTHFTEYLRGLLDEMYKQSPHAVVSKAPGKINYHKVVKLGSYEEVVNHIVDQVFKRLEQTRSTSILLKKVLNHTGVDLTEDVKEEALMHFEVRHLAVHNSGKMDKAFVQRYGDRIKIPAVEGGNFQFNIGFARSAIKSVHRLVKSIDEQLIAGDFIEVPQ